MKKPLPLIHRMLVRSVMSVLGVLFIFSEVHAQEDWSIARQWNEEMLFAITVDLGRPTIHSRNLYHTSMAMYEAWAAYDPTHENWLLGKTRGSYTCPFSGVAIPSDPEELKAAREEAISFAMYRLMSFRFQQANGYDQIMTRLNTLMDDRGYNQFNTSLNYVTGGPAELGNYIAEQIKLYGYTDGANEINAYVNQWYQPQNGIIYPQQPGNPEIVDPNLWQPISVTGQLDQSGQPILNTPGFLSAEWGEMVPFAMSEDDMVVKERDGIDWKIYNDPGPPPLLDTTQATEWEDMYKWGFLMVSAWQSHLDPDDDTMWDISPASKGNIPSYPTEFSDYPNFYNFTEGGETGEGWDINPKTGAPYEPQIVKRGDYARVLAEFWADGPKSYTPPGHWYEIVNDAVLDHPDFERKWMGEGEELDDLEYDVKLYFTLGGSMYDAAVTAWSIKGYYDYIRPVSAIRYMCDKGQSSDPSLDNYHPAGAPLMEGYVEVVEEGDPLAGENNEHVGKIKIYTWMGPDYITYADTVLLQHPSDYAGAGWILGENWWPWQRPKFVSPPFAGYISGHSTFSSTAAEVLERVTGDPFFPGGMGEFVAEQNEFFEFEVGPSTDVVLQWATYRDASDQCSLSRIWGGIHPPIDDIKGRFIGMDLGEGGVNLANELFNADRPYVTAVSASQEVVNRDNIGDIVTLSIQFDREMDTDVVPAITFISDDPVANSLEYLSEEWVNNTEYVFTYELQDGQEKLDNIFVQVNGAVDSNGRTQTVHIADRPITIDTDQPEIANITYNETMLNDNVSENSWLLMTIELDEEADTTAVPAISFDSESNLDTTLYFLPENSMWIDQFTYQATFSVVDNDEEVDNIDVSVAEFRDAAGNVQMDFMAMEQFSLDTRNPEFVDVSVNNDTLNLAAVGNDALQVSLEFDEAMDSDMDPAFVFINDNPLGTSLLVNSVTSGWNEDFTTYNMNFNLTSTPIEMSDIVIQLEGFYDIAGNLPAEIMLSDLFIIDTYQPEVTEITPSASIISDSEVGDDVFEVIVQYQEEMDPSQNPVVTLSADEVISGSIQFSPFSSVWNDDFTFSALFNVMDENVEIEDIQIEINFGEDAAGNVQSPHIETNWINLDTRNPQVSMLSASPTYEVTSSNIGIGGFEMLSLFDEMMDQSEAPALTFDGPAAVNSILSVNNDASMWENNYTYKTVYDVASEELLAEGIAVNLSGARDLAGNEVEAVEFSDYFDIDINSVGVGEQIADLGLTFFPNPLTNGSSLKFDVGRAMVNAELRIVSGNGQVIVQQHYPHLTAGVQEVQLNDVSAGIYYIQIQSEEGNQTQKLVILE